MEDANGEEERNETNELKNGKVCSFLYVREMGTMRGIRNTKKTNHFPLLAVLHFLS